MPGTSLLIALSSPQRRYLPVVGVLNANGSQCAGSLSAPEAMVRRRLRLRGDLLLAIKLHFILG